MGALMAIVNPNDRYETENEERKNAWSILRTIPLYIEDYKKFLNEGDNLKEYFEKKWGFWPPCPPGSPTCNFEFLNYFSSYIDNVDRFNLGSVDLGNLDYFFSKTIDGAHKLFDPNGNQVEYDKENTIIDVKIDLSAPTTLILSELKEKIESIRKTLEIEVNSQKKHNHIEFLILTLKDIGINRKEMRHLLLPANIKSLPSDHEQKKAFLKQIDRVLKKYP